MSLKKGDVVQYTSGDSWGILNLKKGDIGVIEDIGKNDGIYIWCSIRWQNPEVMFVPLTYPVSNLKVIDISALVDKPPEKKYYSSEANKYKSIWDLADEQNPET